MKRPKYRGGHHRAKPPQANTAITAAIILTIILLCALIIWAICAAHKIAGGTAHKVNGAIDSDPASNHLASPSAANAPPCASSSPLVGEPPSSGVPGHLAYAATTHILVDEPLEGGAGADVEYKPMASKSLSPAPQQRDRQAIEMMQVEVVGAQQAREHRIAVWRIDTYLAHKNSPMQGCGEYYIQNQERTGIPGSLSAGIAEAESTNGMRCYNGAWSHNAWGMVGPEYRGGFASWEEGIRANFDYLVKWFGCPQTMHDCPGYCEGNGTMTTVDQVQWQINTYEPPEGV